MHCGSLVNIACKCSQSVSRSRVRSNLSFYLRPRSCFRSLPCAADVINIVVPHTSQKLLPIVTVLFLFFFCFFEWVLSRMSAFGYFCIAEQNKVTACVQVGSMHTIITYENQTPQCISLAKFRQLSRLLIDRYIHVVTTYRYYYI